MQVRFRYSQAVIQVKINANQKKLFRLKWVWLLIAFTASSMFVFGQYPITQKSKRYFTHAEMQELYQETALEVFRWYKIPTASFKEQYASLRNDLYELSNPDLLRAFKDMESRLGAAIMAKADTEQFGENKQLYTQIFQDQILKAFRKNKRLHKWLGFDKTDRISYFKSHVTVGVDGTLKVREDIRIYNGDGNTGVSYTDDSLRIVGADNNEIKRGIIRTFPTRYVDKNNLNSETTFKLISVEMNGAPEPFDEKWGGNGIAVRIGRADQELENGFYTYTINYETRYQIAHLDSLDELAWNVTGNGWGFRIDSAMATIELPKGALVLSNACYTGAQGATDKHCNVVVSIDTGVQKMVFKTTRPLLPYEGITVASSWPKGFVAAPTKNEKMLKMVKDNQLIFLLPILALLLIIFYTIIWKRVGRDPEKGNIIPLFYPPANLSPAAMGFIKRQKFSHKLTAATMVDLAVRHQFVIDQQKEGLLFKSTVYNIKKSTQTPIAVTYTDYRQTAKTLIGQEIKSGKYNATLALLNRNIEADCKKNYQGDKKRAGFFSLNRNYLWVGNLLIFLTTIYLIMWVAVVSDLINQNTQQLLYTGGGLLLCIAVQQFFKRILPAYSSVGRGVLNEIEGFHMYLAAADEQRINMMNPPEKSLELYERYMPFAIALGCENEWGKQFESIIKATGAEPGVAFYGNSFSSNHFDSSSFSNSFVSGLSGSISSASTPPSSSSSGGSSSGGGSSGGGGGGGGGGGW